MEIVNVRDSYTGGNLVNLETTLKQDLGFADSNFIQISAEWVACDASKQLAQISTVIMKLLSKSFQLQILRVMTFHKIQNLRNNRIIPALRS